MTRIERSSQTQTPQSGGTLKRILKTFVYIITLPFKLSIRGAVLLLLVVIFVFVVLTGIWHIPVVSDIIYHEPQPIRLVEPGLYSKNLLKIQTEQQAEDATFSRIAIDITEEQLNALFQESVASSSKYPFSFSQLAIEPSYIEFYGRLAARTNVVLRAHVVPTVKDGDVHMTIDRAYVGRVAIPHALIPAGIIDTFTPSLVSGILDVVTIQSVDMTKGHLLLTVKPI